MTGSTTTVHLVHGSEAAASTLRADLAACGARVRSFPSEEAWLEDGRPESPQALYVEPGAGRALPPVLLAQARAALVPVVLVASPAFDLRALVRAIREGVLDVLVAPYTQTDLRSVLEAAVATAARWHVERAQRDGAAALFARLTQREHEVLDWLLAGKVNKQIADLLQCEVATVKVHRCRLMRKLGVRTQFALFELARTAWPASEPPAVRQAPRPIGFPVAARQPQQAPRAAPVIRPAVVSLNFCAVPQRARLG